MKNFKSLLILRPDNIGDCILFSGTLKYYRELFPEYNITLALKKNIIPLFEHSKFIDETIEYERLSYIRQRKNKLLNRVERLIKEFRKIFIFFNNQKKKWDIIICPVRSINKEILWVINSLNSKEKIGIVGCNANCSVKDIHKAKKVFTKSYNLGPDEMWQHEIETNFKFLKMLGARAVTINDIYPKLYLSDIYDDNEILKKYNLNDYIILAPFAAVNFRILDNDTCDKIIKKMKNYSMIVIVGTNEFYFNAERLKNYIKSNGKKIINLCGKTKFNDLLTLIKNSESIITTDTSILHFSIMLKKKIYAVVGGGHWGRFFPWGDNENIIWLNNKMDCYQCNWICKYKDFRCVRNINLDKIN